MFVLLGSNGQITGQLARRLLAAGHRTRVVGRNAAALAPLAQAGAEVVVGDAADAGLLARAFEGATAAYVMTPPTYGAPDMPAAQARLGQAIAAALARQPVKRVVSLSSVGADLPTGTGPIAGLHAQEQRLNALAGIDLLHLRPGYFMENFLHTIPVIAAAGVLPSMEAPDAKIPMAATADIAAVAARELTQPRARGVLHLHAPHLVTMRQAAAALGAAIGRPQLPYVQADPQEAMAAMQAHGFSASAAREMATMAAWLSTEPLGSLATGPLEVVPTTFDAFARQVFAPAFAAASRQAQAA